MKTVRIGTNNIYIKDIIIAIIIAVLPFLFFIYKLAPETQVWDLGLFEIKTSGFNNVSIFVWQLNSKLLVFISLSIWFITCKNWWRLVILVPLIIELFKISSLLKSEFKPIDQFEFLHALPLVIPITILIYILSKKLNYYSNSLILNQELNMEIESLFESISSNNRLKMFRNELNNLKMRKGKHTDESYLNELIELRNKIQSHL